MQTRALPNDYVVNRNGQSDFHDSGISWGAVFAGAATAAALSLILLVLGVGLGLWSMSPWSFNATAIGVSSILWLSFMQFAASGVGGYMAGRLRIKWASVHTDEVFFRDTAHGLVVWAIATLFTVSVSAGAVHALLGGAAKVGGGVATAASGAGLAAASATRDHGEGAGTPGNPVDYFSDMLMRSPPAQVAAQAISTDNSENASDSTPGATPAAAAQGSDTHSPGMHAEISKILLTDLPAGNLPPEDRAYLAQLVAQRTGASQADAQVRVDAVYAQAQKSISDAKESAKEDADAVRKDVAHTALWLFVSLLIGAFIASLMATYGGRLRDSDHLHVRD